MSVLILLVLAVACALPAWSTRLAGSAAHPRTGPWRSLWWAAPASATACLTGAAVLAAAGGPAEPPVLAALATAVSVAVAVTGGGPVTLAVLRLASRSPNGGAEAAPAPPPDVPGVLRGGAWIGGLERATVAATLLAGWPEGLAVALAVKGLGRYPELRHPGAAERFIIGTLASVLWASAAAGTGALAAGLGR